MSEVVCIKPQEEYLDDFEKDLDWLINEESRGEGQVSQLRVILSLFFLFPVLPLFFVLLRVP